MAISTTPIVSPDHPVSDRPTTTLGFASAFFTSNWVNFLLRRLANLLIILVVLVTVVFAIVRLIPGDPGLIVDGPNATKATVEQTDAALGVNKPILTQYGHYWSEIFHGNLGNSFINEQPVTQIISQNIGSSLQLIGGALIVVLGLSIPGGMIAAALTRDGRHRRFEVGFTATTSFFGSIPEMISATILAFFFAVLWHLFAVGGNGGLRQLVLPVLAISIRPIAVMMRLVRVEALTALGTDFIRTAKSKRLPMFTIYARHVLPNVVTAAFTVGGLIFANLIASAVIVEVIFARSGLGTALVNAVLSKDYPTIQGLVLVLGVAVVMVNAIVDLTLALLDPRQVSRTAR